MVKFIYIYIVYLYQDILIFIFKLTPAVDRYFVIIKTIIPCNLKLCMVTSINIF